LEARKIRREQHQQLLEGLVHRHRRPVPVADAIPVGVPEADDLGDPRLLHGRRDPRDFLEREQT
jgi:hypothetical protein